jgi:diacylglycerol kinase family enzyme
MRITLMHNPKAGDGEHGREELMRALADAGHQAVYQSIKEADYKKALKEPTDVVLAAGGDGSVAKVAARLIDRGIPLAILPLGTANNLARSLGFTASPEEIIAGLDRGKKHVFDVGVARGPWGKRYFFEGAGAGLLADYVRAAEEEDKTPKRISKEQEMTRHVALMRRMLHEFPAREWKIELDGKDISGPYILWEAMNIRSVGPVLHFAPRATVKDGRFDFVCVREEDRSRLLKYFDARVAERKSKFPFPIRRFKKLKIIWETSTIHFDDKLWPRNKEKPKDPTEIKITVKPCAIVILQPPVANAPR